MDILKRAMASSLFLHVLAALFGSSSWLSVKSVFLEMPLMLPHLPEGWQLPSYLTLITQIAIIGPLLYGAATKCCYKGQQLNLAPLIVFTLVCVIVFTALMAFFWDTTEVIFGQRRSVVVYLLVFGMALVNCTSNVLFMPFMVAFQPAHLSAYFAGMGISALVPSLVSLVQGANRVICSQNEFNNETIRETLPARFSVTTYNVILMPWLMLSLLAFCLLNWHPATERHRSVPRRLNEMANKKIITRDEKISELSEHTPLNIKSSDYGVSTATNHGRRPHSDVVERGMSRYEYWFYLLVSLLASAFMNSILPSIQTYNSLPYGISTYHYAVTLESISNVLACFVPFFVTFDRPMLPITAVSAVAAVSSAYLVVLASMSPTPLLVGSVWGDITCVTASIVSIGTLAYVRTAAASAIRTGTGDIHSRLFWCGIFTQTGSLLGAAVIFPLVNIVKIFTSVPFC